MCNFFSFVHDGKRIYYFNGEQRKNGVKMPDGNKIGGYDSHSSITCFYGLDDDAVNKFEYNPYTDKLALDGPCICQWEEKRIREALGEVDWEPIAGDVAGAREFIAGLRKIPWFQPDGSLQDGEDGIRLFETRDAARAAARAAAWDAAWAAASDVARAAAWAAARDAARAAARDAAWEIAWATTRAAARDAAWEIAWAATWDVGLYALIMYVCAGLDFDKWHKEYAKKRMDVWRKGYGVVCDAGGVLYCYRQIG